MSQMPKLETCFYLPPHTHTHTHTHTQPLKKLNSFPGREEVDGRHACTSSTFFDWFHEGKRKSLGKLTAAVDLTIEKVQEQLL